jgi:hypothetical protein
MFVTLIFVAIMCTTPAYGQQDEPIIQISESLAQGDRIAKASLLGYFTVEGDTDFYDGQPHSIYWLCFQSRNEFDQSAACDFISFTEGYGPSRAIVPFSEALDPLRGQEALFWIMGCESNQANCETSFAYSMRVALSNIALSPPAFENEPPYNGVFPRRDTVFESLGSLVFRWPLATTDAPSLWSGDNDGAERHILRLQLQESSPEIGGARLSDAVTYDITLGSLSASATAMSGGLAQLVVLGSNTFIEFYPTADTYSQLLDQVNADQVNWQVATCTTIAGQEVCSTPENLAHHGRGGIGIPGNDIPGDPDLPLGGLTFAESPLLDAFEHPACLRCHTLARDAAEAANNFAISHLNFNGGAVENLSNPERCANCHSSNEFPADDFVVPPILDTEFAARHDLDELTPQEWWSWFAPQYEDQFTWPDHLEDPTSDDYDPSSACSLMSQGLDADALRHHFFEDPRVIWSIVGGDLPNGGFVDELAPPGTSFDITTTAGLEAALSAWEDMANEWIDDGMNCGSTVTGNSVGFSASDNFIPPSTTPDYGGGNSLLGATIGSGSFAQVHLDCRDVRGERCENTFFACGRDADAVAQALANCDENAASTFAIPPLSGVSAQAACDNDSSSACFKMDLTVGTNVAIIPPVSIPSEIGDSTTLAFYSTDEFGSVEGTRTETYTFVAEDTVPPTSSAKVAYNDELDRYEVQFTCSDNNGDCVPPEQGLPAVVVFRTIDDLTPSATAQFPFAEEDTVPQLNNVQIYGLFDSVQVLNPTVVQRIRWLAVDPLVNGRFNAEFDGNCPAAFSAVTGTEILTRTADVECYHEQIFDPAVYANSAPPTTAILSSSLASASGQHESEFAVSLVCDDPVNNCSIFYTLDGSDPQIDVRMQYTSSIIIPAPPEGTRVATTTLKYFAVDDAVPLNASAIETATLTVTNPHTDDDGDGYAEDTGDCNDNDFATSPDAAEVCDGIDNDCDGVADEGLDCNVDIDDVGPIQDDRPDDEPQDVIGDQPDADDTPAPPDPVRPAEEFDTNDDDIRPVDDTPQQEPVGSSLCGAASPAGLLSMMVLLGAFKATRRPCRTFP